MVGACVLLALFVLVLLWGFSIALRSQHHFGRLVALGVTSMMFLYVFINTSMVMGLLPVVGVPLPLVSNGGTAMVSVMFACGLLIGVNVYRDAQLGAVAAPRIRRRNFPILAYRQAGTALLNPRLFRHTPVTGGA